MTRSQSRWRHGKTVSPSKSHGMGPDTGSLREDGERRGQKAEYCAKDYVKKYRVLAAHHRSSRKDGVTGSLEGRFKVF